MWVLFLGIWKIVVCWYCVRLMRSCVVSFEFMRVWIRCFEFLILLNWWFCVVINVVCCRCLFLVRERICWLVKLSVLMILFMDEMNFLRIMRLVEFFWYSWLLMYKRIGVGFKVRYFWKILLENFERVWSYLFVVRVCLDWVWFWDLFNEFMRD